MRGHANRCNVNVSVDATFPNVSNVAVNPARFPPGDVVDG